MKRATPLILAIFLLLSAISKGQTQEICPQPIPVGWVVISNRACAGCCGSHEIIQMPTIKRVDNLPSGSRLEICPQPIPAGWVVISNRACAGCCGSHGIIQMPTIKKL